LSQATEGGVAHAVEDLVREQVESGWDVVVASPPGRLADLVEATEAQWHQWDARREPGPSVLSEALRLQQLVRGVKPDLLHLHSAKAGLVGRLVVRGRLPTIYTPHAWSWLAVTGGVRSAAQQWEKAAGRWCDVTICLSHQEQVEAAAVGVGCVTRLIPNTVDGAAVRALVIGDRDSSRTALGVPSGAPLAVCCARLAPQKGQDQLLDAWRQVNLAIPDAQLTLVGDGPSRKDLEDRSRNLAGVQFAGMQDRAGALQWMSAADVVVCPSRYEGMSLVPLEAAALGRPVVAFDVEGMRGGPPADARWLLPPGDSRQLADALVTLLGDRPRMSAAGAEAREWFDRHQLTTPGAADRTRQLYHEVLSARQAKRPLESRLT